MLSLAGGIESVFNNVVIGGVKGAKLVYFSAGFSLPLSLLTVTNYLMIMRRKKFV